MEFQRFQEEQTQQRFQQPVGFNPARAIGQGDAIRQQYQQTQNSKQFYNQSLDARNQIFSANWQQRGSNQKDNDLNKFVDAMQDYLPTAKKALEDVAQREIQRREADETLKEWNRVYDNGFDDNDREQEAAGLATENAGNTIQAEAKRDAPNSEISRIMSIKDGYRKAAAARVYATRVAQQDPFQLQDYLRNYLSTNPNATSADIRGAVASYNGQQWVQSGLSQFKPQFLGEKFVQTLRANQEKVINTAIKQNNISKDELLRIENVSNLGAITPANANAQFQTFIASQANSLNAAGNPYGNTKSLTDFTTALVDQGKSLDEINDILMSIDDPVVKGKKLGQRPDVQRKLKVQVYNRKAETLKIQRQQEDDQFRQLFQPFAEKYAAASPEQRPALAQQFREDTSSLLYADKSAFNNLVRGLKDPERRNNVLLYLDDLVRSGKRPTRETLDGYRDVLLPSDYNKYLQLTKDPDEDRIKERDEQLDAAIKSIGSTGYYKDLGGETGLTKTPVGERLMDVLQTEFGLQLAQVERDADFKGMTRDQQYQEATRRTIKAAESKYAVGLTTQEVERRKGTDTEISNPIFATEAGDAPDNVIGINTNLELRNAKLDATDVDKAGSLYNLEQLQKRREELEKGGLALRPTYDEQRIMQAQGISFSDLFNRQARALKQPEITPTEFDRMLDGLSQGARNAILNPATSETQRQRLLGTMQPAPPPTVEQLANAPKPAQGGFDYQMAQKPDAQGNWFNKNAVLLNAEYGRHAAPYLSMIEQASAESGVPAGIIAAVAGQESHFKNFKGAYVPPDLHGCNGGGLSRALGPMQVLDSCHPGAPDYRTDMQGHFTYAAKYLMEKYQETGNWLDALKKYNGGYANPDYGTPVINNAFSYGAKSLLTDGSMVRETFKMN